MAISDLILAYYNCKFDLDRFVLEHEQIIRKYAIESFLKNTHINRLRHYILDMIDDFNPTIIIHDDFDNKILIAKMSKYLKTYFMIIYSLDTRTNKISNRKKLEYDLYKFQTENPTFGRKILKIFKK